MTDSLKIFKQWCADCDNMLQLLDPRESCRAGLVAAISAAPSPKEES